MQFLSRQIVIIILLVSTFSLKAQIDSCWTVLILKKGRAIDTTQPTKFKFNSQGFYLYRNCIYEITLKNKISISGRLIEILPDTFIFSKYFNNNVAAKAKDNQDTIKVHYGDLDQLRLIADRAYGWYETHRFDNFDFIFKKDTAICLLESEWYPIFSNDTTNYEIVPHLTAQGYQYLFEENGRTYYFQGAGMLKPDRSKFDETYDKKNIIWLTPCKVEVINGIAIGLHTKNIKNNIFNERDSLVVNGLSLELNPFSLFSLVNPKFNGPYPDSINLYNEKIKNDWQVKVNGVNISIVNTINEMRINGLNITGINTVVDEINGVSISGINNFCYIQKGICIAGIRNRATNAKGVQIGLFNRASDLRGIQIGLWNKNKKRSLPFINWQFKS